jgi:iron complex transport system ATP-binding protein
MSGLEARGVSGLEAHSVSGLEARGVSATAGGTLIIDGIDCTVPAGSFTALVGPNGAGKSTLLRTLAAVERPHAGSVRFAGSDLLTMHRRARARVLAFVEQDAATELALTVREVVALGRVPHESLLGGVGLGGVGLGGAGLGGAASGTSTVGGSDAVIARALETVGMSDFAERVLTSLSGGERQRVLLAKALAQEPQMLLLDEPTNHLDIGAGLETLELLRSVAASGSTVLAALHDLNLAATWCDRVIVVANGKVVAAGPATQTLTAELIGDVYGVEATVLTNPTTGSPVIAFSPRRKGTRT